MTSIANDSNALARYVEHLGGEIVEARTFQFEIPLEKVREVLPEIYKLGGLRCERVSERIGTNPLNGTTRTLTTIEVRRQPEQSTYDEERGLMAALIR
jgi:hypothetical protein